MQTGRNDFTFKALLDMSLGSSQLTPDHLALLHSLIIALLQKLNSLDEIVTIKGFEAQCLVKLLKECHDTPYECKVSNDLCMGSKMEKVDELIQRSEKISQKLENHFELGRLYKHKVDNLFSGDKWDFYTGNAEDICSLPGRKCLLLCQISCHGHFNQKLRKLMTEPVLQRLFEFENIVDDMEEHLNELIINMAKTFAEKNLLGPLISSIETTRKQINDNHNQFLDAMKEVQEMLQAKLDRIAYPAIRTYLKHYFETIWKTLASLQKESGECPSTKPLSITKGTCLSCGTENTPLSKQISAQNPNECPPLMALCTYQPEITLRTRMQYLNISLITAASQFKLQ